MKTMDRSTKDMIPIRIAYYKEQGIFIMRGKYSKKHERLYLFANFQFCTFQEAKDFIDSEFEGKN